MSCHFELIEDGPAGRIETCVGCGCVAIHVGPMTMRVDRGTFLQLAAAMLRARTSLEGRVTIDASMAPRGQA